MRVETLLNHVQKFKSFVYEKVRLVPVWAIAVIFVYRMRRVNCPECGVKVDEDAQRVYFPPGLVTESIKLAPAEFTLHARDPQKDLQIGGGTIQAVGTDIAFPPGSLTDLQTLGLYVNIHTTTNPGGEIRGQLIPTS